MDATRMPSDRRRPVLRRALLQAIQAAGNHGSTSDVLHASLLSGGFEGLELDEVLAEIFYLDDKGYVFFTRHSDTLAGKRLHVLLTPKAVDLLAGNIPADPGVA